MNALLLSIKQGITRTMYKCLLAIYLDECSHTELENCFMCIIKHDPLMFLVFTSFLFVYRIICSA